MGTRKHKFRPQEYGWKRNVIGPVKIGSVPKEYHRARMPFFTFMIPRFLPRSGITGGFSMKMGTLSSSMKKR
ncbi:MAG: hypothetical protein HOI65_01475 [Opitutae bacterium]|jgi:hypothetical protein|nr:hypothetical protein [Opitutae bacterium]